MRTEIETAHIPTWLRMRMLEAYDKDDLPAWLDVGYHLGRYHLDDFCEVPDWVHDVDHQQVMADPERVLRRIFASEEHPRGELTDLIEPHNRLMFLLGLLAGVDEEELSADSTAEGGWLEVAESLGAFRAEQLAAEKKREREEEMERDELDDD